MPKQNSSRKKQWFKRLSLLFLLISLLWIGLISLFSYQTYQHLKSAQAALQTINSNSLQTSCKELQAANHNATLLRTIQLPLSPMLVHLGWVPKIGTELSLVPELLDLAVHTEPLVNQVCSLHPSYYAILEQPTELRVTQIVQTLTNHPLDFKQLATNLKQVEQAWDKLPQRFFHLPMLQNIKDMAFISQYLENAQAACILLDTFNPVLDTLGAFNQQKTYLVALQNPNELRPSGGFIGSLALIQLQQGRIISSTFYNSADLGATAGPASDMPEPYNDYLRASIWTLRDANWWADWPTSAQTIAAFWELNEQPELDGIIAIDLYLLATLLDIYPQFTLPQSGNIQTTLDLESIYSLYDTEEQVTGNKAFLGQLVQSMLQQIQDSTWQETLAVAAAILDMLQQQHINIWSNDSQIQNLLIPHRWDGGQRFQVQDGLQIINADLSYSDVFMFIEQELALDIWTDQAPFTHTVTLTYSNRYSDWSAPNTNHRVWGYCYNPEQAQQELITGCLGNYIQITTPAGAAIDSGTTAEKLTVNRQNQTTTFGTYSLLYPGETKVISLSYTFPSQQQAIQQFELLKQAGTLANLYTIRTHTITKTQIITSDSLYDRILTFESPISIEPIEQYHDQNPQLRQIYHDQQHALNLWNSGDQATAINYWQTTQTISTAFDQVEYLYLRKEYQAAQTLLEKLASSVARAHYLQGLLYETSNDFDKAEQAYIQSHTQQSDHPAPLWKLALLADQQGEYSKTVQYLEQLPEAKVFLRQAGFNQRFIGNYKQADHYQSLLLELYPNDITALEERYWLNRYGITPPDWTSIINISNAGLGQQPNQLLWYQRRAEAYTANNQISQALADWYLSVEYNPNSSAWNQIGILEIRQNNPEQAITAWQKALELEPNPALYLELATLYKQQNRTSEAKQTYQLALKKYPDRQDIQELLNSIED